MKAKSRKKIMATQTLSRISNALRGVCAGMVAEVACPYGTSEMINRICATAQKKITSLNSPFSLLSSLNFQAGLSHIVDSWLVDIVSPSVQQPKVCLVRKLGVGILNFILSDDKSLLRPSERTVLKSEKNSMQCLNLTTWRCDEGSALNSLSITVRPSYQTQ